MCFYSDSSVLQLLCFTYSHMIGHHNCFIVDEMLKLVDRKIAVTYEVLTLSEGVQWQASLSRLDAEQSLPLKVEQVLLLDLLDLQELLLESQLLC